MTLGGNLSLDEMAALLNASGKYQTLRRLEPRRVLRQPDASSTRLGIFLDVETTGLDPTRDEVIEIAMVPFTYALDGRIFEVHEPFERIREPSKPIPAEITAITGITDEMVRGHVLDSGEILAFASKAAIIVAHNAAFDRRFAEQLSDVFVTKPWACSMTEVDWAKEGFEGTKLVYLAMKAGFFYERHRAMNDCIAALELLSLPLPNTGTPALNSLLECARQPTFRIWAENSPFDLKDILKARGYRWNAEGNAKPRAWYIDVTEDTRDAELSFLKNEIYQRDVELLVRKITAYERYSDRI